MKKCGEPVRVVSGTARGLSLKAVPGKGTRPTTDKVKEALFSMIGPYFEGGYVLDLFAGTGGLGIEALSRGMDRGIFIDMDPKAVEVIKQNLQTTQLVKQAEVYRNDARRAIKSLAKRGTSFTLVFLDPPYRMNDADDLVVELEAKQLLSSDVIVVIEHDADVTYADRIGGLDLWKRSAYGDTIISIYHYDVVVNQDAQLKEGIEDVGNT